jgi:hypothetical protein
MLGIYRPKASVKLPELRVAKNPITAKTPPFSGVFP